MMRKILGLSEWQWYAIFTVVAVIVALIGITANVAWLAGLGVLVLLFSFVGMVYGILKERGQ
ncbi:MAG TPA: hypothetical protein VMS79_05080 [Methanomassiliicoccales archaeon]|jgi:hypothetical protein|nr:hypothetical protein [Methanomassiliicoccales archaeon]